MNRFLLLVVTLAIELSPRILGADPKAKKRDTLYSEIYRDINDMGYCVRLTNANQSIGCATGPNGVTGTVYLIESSADVDWVLNTGKIAPYVPLLDQNQFYDRSLMMRFKEGAKSGRVSGIVVDFLTESYDYQAHGSPEHQCPNPGFGGIGSHCDPIWNPNGTALSFENFNFPVFGLRDKNQLDALKNCSILFNKRNSTSACQVHMRAFMYASVDTPTCMRKASHVVLSTNGFCDPLENPSYWGTLFSPADLRYDSPKPVVMVTTKMDTSAFFHQLAFGANNDATGIVTLLAALEALGNLKRNHNFTQSDVKKSIIFVFFNGEEWDYIGSSRMVYNLENHCERDDKNCEVGSVGDSEVPVSRFITLNSIESFLELSQIGFPDEGGTLFGYKFNETHSNDLFDTMAGYSRDDDWSLSSVPDKMGLPPSSFLQFRAKMKSIVGVVLADHSGSYKNRHYGSAFDDARSLNQNAPSNLAKVAKTVAKTLLKLADADEKWIGLVETSETTISTLLRCFLQEMNCSLFQNLSSSDDAAKLPLGKAGPRYISVSGDTPNAVTLVQKLAIYYTGNLANVKNDDCEDGPIKSKDSKKSHYLETMVLNRGENICRYGYVYTTDAKSPAFLKKDYGSSEYSTWAESRWDVDPTLSFYVATSDHVENVSLGLGLTMFILSFFGVWYATRKTSRLSATTGQYTVNAPA